MADASDVGWPGGLKWTQEPLLANQRMEVTPSSPDSLSVAAALPFDALLFYSASLEEDILDSFSFLPYILFNLHLIWHDS
jgi:hypothetical protein